MKHIKLIAISSVVACLNLFFGIYSYDSYLGFAFGSNELISSSPSFIMTASLVNGILFTIASIIISMIVLTAKRTNNKALSFQIVLSIINIILFTAIMWLYRRSIEVPSNKITSIDITNLNFYPQLAAS
ncbi:hypothetical protein QDZ86_005725, partial [Pluralibacter gergoviae]|nr:hypothetical protein [Pluralibacter gergoviae]